MTVKSTVPWRAGLVLGLSLLGFSLAAGGSPAHAAAAADHTYVAQGDDTFWLISKKLNVPLQALVDANPDVSATNIYPGLTIRLPETSASGTVHTASAEAPAEAATLMRAASTEPTVTAASGEVLAYSKTISAVASAYSDSPSENGAWGAVDYFGKPLALGTIAVDPSVIPLGTKVYVTGYTFSGLPTGIVATASDMGGAIKGNRIDMFIPRSVGNAWSFGLQNVTIYVLK
ncbi:3D domain-containing protein [Paenibacillus chartarius]|uniref:3D domain-containing protein n=1 Tax=Paenibacillus chartarius TaxID=747481 RepID=A0ABV6DN71_9BACL